MLDRHHAENIATRLADQTRTAQQSGDTEIAAILKDSLSRIELLLRLRSVRDSMSNWRIGFIEGLEDTLTAFIETDLDSVRLSAQYAKDGEVSNSLSNLIQKLSTLKARYEREAQKGSRRRK